MTTDRWMRASDQDRESAAEMLREAYAVGRLAREEFDERSDAAYSARTWACCGTRAKRDRRARQQASGTRRPRVAADAALPGT